MQNQNTSFYSTENWKVFLQSLVLTLNNFILFCENLSIFAKANGNEFFKVIFESMDDSYAKQNHFSASFLSYPFFVGLVKSEQRLVGQKLFHYQVDLKIQTYAKSIWSPVAQKETRIHRWKERGESGQQCVRRERDELFKGC